MHLSDLWSCIKSYVRYIDKTLLFICILSTAYGVILIYSATYSYNTLQYVKVQTIAAVFGVIIYMIAACFNIEFISKHWKILFVLNLMLIASLFFFSTGSNNRNWIRIPLLGLSIQPAEIGKILFIITFASHLHEANESDNKIRNILFLFLHVALTAGCVVFFSKDDGMTIAYLFIALFMAFSAGVKYRWFVAGGVCTMISVPLLWKYVLDNYQKLRIMVVFNPTVDPDKAYQAAQSKIALGNGSLTGKGFLHGTQTQYSLIPTKHTDSIFAVAGEELGFIGALVIIVLLTLIVLRCFYISCRTVGTSSSIIALGMGIMICFQMLLNIGMNIGILPIIGLTLPFISYGGTSLVTMYVAMGIVAGIRMREKSERGRRNGYKSLWE